jgi:hypothetical protein
MCTAYYMQVSRVVQSVYCLATGWTTERSRFDPRKRWKDSPLTSVSRPALGPTQPPVQWVPRVLSPVVKRGRGVTLTTHPDLVPRSRMSRSYTSSPTKPLRGVQWDSFIFIITLLLPPCFNVRIHFGIRSNIITFHLLCGYKLKQYSCLWY